MNELTTIDPFRAPVVMLPSDPMQLMALAKDLANARLIPSQFQKSPADCWLVMSFCLNRRMDFFMVAPECNVVKGRLFFSGKLTQALLNTSGYLAERINFEYEGTGDDLAVIVSGRLTTETTPRIVRVELKRVRTENEMWRKQPEQQLAYAGARIWGRRHLPEVLMGLMFEGETIDVTPNVIATHLNILHEQRKTHPAMSQDERSQIAEQGDTADYHPSLAQAADTEAGMVPSVDLPSTAEREATLPVALPISDTNTARSWSTWASLLMAYVRAAPDANVINEWTTANAASLAKLKEYDAAKHARLVEMIDHQIAKRDEEGNDAR